MSFGITVKALMLKPPTQLSSPTELIVSDQEVPTYDLYHVSKRSLSSDYQPRGNAQREMVLTQQTTPWSS